MPADLTVAEGSHRLVGAPRLRLRVADLLLMTLAAGQCRRHTLLLLGHHGLVHVLLHEPLVLSAALVRLQVLETEVDKLRGVKLAREQALAQLRVRPVLDVLVQRAHLGAVAVAGRAAELLERSRLDIDGTLEDEIGHCSPGRRMTGEQTRRLAAGQT